MNKLLSSSLIILTLSISAFSCQTKTEAKNGSEAIQQSQIIERVDNARFVTLLEEKKDAKIIDIRTPEEFAEGYIGNAVNINFYDSNFKDQLAELDKSTPVLMYCKSGGRSGRAVKVFKELGFEEVYELGSGYSSWEK